MALVKIKRYISDHSQFVIYDVSRIEFRTQKRIQHRCAIAVI